MVDSIGPSAPPPPARANRAAGVPGPGPSFRAFLGGLTEAKTTAQKLDANPSQVLELATRLADKAVEVHMSDEAFNRQLADVIKALETATKATDTLRATQAAIKGTDA